MSVQWLRNYRLLVQKANGKETAIDLSGFRIVFRITQGLIGKPCTAEISVFNVASETVASIDLPVNTPAKADERLRVTLETGYGDDLSVAFSGELWWKSVGRSSQTETYMRLIATSGDTAYHYAVVNVSAPKGTTQTDLYKMYCEEFERCGVSAGKKPEFANGSLPRGKAIYKPLRDCMNEITSTNSQHWSIGSGGLLVSHGGSEYKEGETIFVINSSSGMIGRPTLSAVGVNLRVLLNAKIDIDSLVHIDNSTVTREDYNTEVKAVQFTADDSMISADGLYRVVSRTHIGDTYGDDWYTDLICVGVNAAIPWVPRDVLNYYSNV